MNTIHASLIASITTLLAFHSLAGAEAKEMTFRLASNGGNCNGCEWIAADGEITPGSPEKLAELLSAGRYGSVVFNSPGGNLAASIRMGRMIRSAGYSTQVGETIEVGQWDEVRQGTCASACAFAFLGGTARYADRGRLGVHQFYSEEAISRPDDQLFTAVDLSVNQYIEALLMEYAIQMGADYRIVLTAAATPPTEMHFLTKEELENWKVAFDPDSFEPWEIETWKSGVVAFSKSRDGNKTATVFCSNPRNPKLLISATETDFHAPFNPVSSYTSAVDALGTQVPSDRITMSEKDGQYTLLLGLDDLNIEDLKDREDVGVSAFNYAARYAMPYFEFNLSASGAYENIRIALRNCI